jgi:mono/diheme cytochrome c family protein
MKRKGLLLMSIAFSLLFVVGSLSFAADTKKAPEANVGAMMMEHVGMDCSNCHGENGPKGVHMGSHPGMKCTDCHRIVDKKMVIVKAEKKTKISQELMLKHGASFNCKTCHGEKGPKGMMMEHEGMDCKICHVVEAR